MAASIHARHIQDYGDKNVTYKHYWAYPSRQLPCTSDAGTCAYLDAVYWMQTVSMTYTFILWGVILGILAVWLLVRGWRMDQTLDSLLDRLCNAVEVGKRRWLLRDTPLKVIFGRVSRVQVMVLACLSGYLLIFSLVGIVYKTWITPVKHHPNLYNTRTGLGGFSDRIGAFAYALTPFAVLLSQRESMLSLLTGIPYQHFNFLHRWLGRIIFIQSFIHTFCWTLIEGNFYKPQPTEYARLMSEQYIIFGVVAMFFLTFLYVFSCKWAIRWTGYEFFKVTHWIVAILYIAACWGHWAKLACWMIPSIALIFIDQGVRILRILALHVRGGQGQGIGFRCAQAELKLLGEGDDVVLRIDFDFEHREAWHPGQHFYLTFPSLSIIQAHPFTPSSLPNPNSRVQHHTYLIRVRQGQTAKLAALAMGEKVPVVLAGPYGKAYPSYEAQNVLAVGGGTGASISLPIAFEALRQNTLPQAAVSLVWVVRRAGDLLWLASEMGELKDRLKTSPGLNVSIFVTREDGANDRRAAPQVVESEKQAEATVTSKETSLSGDSALQDLLASSSARFSVEFLGRRHPSMAEVVAAFMERSAGEPVEIIGSGPEGMGSDLRAAVSDIGTDEPVNFYWDSRE